MALPAESMGPRGVDPSTVAIARASMASAAVRVRPISSAHAEAPDRRSTPAFGRPLMTRATITTPAAIDAAKAAAPRRQRHHEVYPVARGLGIAILPRRQSSAGGESRRDPFLRVSSWFGGDGRAAFAV